MAEVVGSVLVQECLSKAISFVLGRREEKASQGVIAERLEMAVSQLEFALERTAKLPVTELSLLHRRKMIKRAYLEATELLNKHKQLQALQEGQQEEVAKVQGARRSRWITIRAKNNLSISSSFVGLKTDDVRRFEWFADHAGKFVRDVESGCSHLLQPSCEASS
jgi:phosphoenolpyruvate synthase/pyruvate phosphate dikinase